MINLMMLEGRPAKEVPDVLMTKVPSTVVASWLLWVPAQLVNFAFIPGKFQVLFSNGAGFVWNAYLSWKTQDEGEVGL